MKPNKIIPVFTGIFLILLLFSNSPICAEEIFSTDFSGSAAGEPPSDAVVEGMTEQVYVVDAASEPSAPFGGAENKILKIQKQQMEEDIPRATWTFPETAAGVVRFKAYTVENEDFPNPLLNVFLFSDKVSARGPDFYFSKRTLSVYDEMGECLRFENQWNSNEGNIVEVHFFDDRTYSIEINGEPVDGGRRFAYREGVLTINAIQFAVASGEIFGSQFFIDDISIRSEK